MKILENANSVLIEFGKLNTKLRILFFFAAVTSLPFITTGIVRGSTTLNNGEYGLLAICIGMILLGCAIIFRYLTRVFQSEKMLITKDTISIINATLLKKQENTYDISGITFLNYMGKGKKTDHPLKGNSFDYLGFETQELVIAEVNNDGNLSFGYNNKIINFGRDVYSWDAEKINEVLAKVTDNKLTIGNLTTDTNESEAEEAFSPDEH